VRTDGGPRLPPRSHILQAAPSRPRRCHFIAGNDPTALCPSLATGPCGLHPGTANRRRSPRRTWKSSCPSGTADTGSTPDIPTIQSCHHADADAYVISATTPRPSFPRPGPGRPSSKVSCPRLQTMDPAPTTSSSTSQHGAIRPSEKSTCWTNQSHSQRADIAIPVRAPRPRNEHPDRPT